MSTLSNYVSQKCKDANVLAPLKNVCDKDVPYSQDLSTFTTTDIPHELKEYLLGFMEMNIAISPVAYKSIPTMQSECIDFIADLWNAPRKSNGEAEFVGVATIGSSEACIMAGISMLSRWKKRNLRRFHYGTKKPNIIVSSALQVCWKKFADLFDVELRKIPITQTLCAMQVERLDEAIDDYTIGVASIFANTLAGLYDEVKAINDIVENNNKKYNRDVTIHVDAASGGFYAPFIQRDTLFDFQLKNVVSINASGHKFGLAPPAIGWLIFRGNEYLSDALKNELDYLGGSMLKDVGINFSKSAMPLASQYFLFKVLGVAGYGELISNCDKVSRYVADEISKIPELKLITKGDIPTVIYTTSDKYRFNLRDLEGKLRNDYKWQVPTYELPDIGLDVHRVVVRTDLTMQLAEEFINVLKTALKNLNT